MDKDSFKFTNDTNSGLYGLVLCGGKSSRMGTDKSMLVYDYQPQCYQLYEMLNMVCEKVFISCKLTQVDQFIPTYSLLPDLEKYDNIGPAGALLTAFDTYTGKSFLLIACDYPFLTVKDIRNFLDSRGSAPASAFFNRNTGFYEPLLAYYHHNCTNSLSEMFREKEYSLQQFLKKNSAKPYYPRDYKVMQSVDTPEQHIKAVEIIRMQG